MLKKYFKKRAVFRNVTVDNIQTSSVKEQTCNRIITWRGKNVWSGMNSGKMDVPGIAGDRPVESVLPRHLTGHSCTVLFHLTPVVGWDASGCGGDLQLWTPPGGACAERIGHRTKIYRL